MEKISSEAGRPLRFVEPEAMKRYYELRSDAGISGTLRFESPFGTLANAETASGKWSFKRVGFLNPHVTVREAGSQNDIAVFFPRFWGGGVIELKNGKRFHWRSLNFWSTKWGFVDEQGQPVLSFTPGSEENKLSDILKHQATVEADDSAWSLPELPLLVMAGWYLMILQYQDAAAAGAVT